MQNARRDLLSVSRLWQMNREIFISSRKRETGTEIWEATGGNIDYLVALVGT